ncbi:unnamed protein product [Spirodela intermedia]|uniref:DYW domain-containing protein n=1 Tax=Spirodela intermedia TaxID=51605 RepID=A0A7I8LIQ4_SPIIN|nr:unnamed protein product [Spirodela intermedia]
MQTDNLRCQGLRIPALGRRRSSRRLLWLLCLSTEGFKERPWPRCDSAIRASIVKGSSLNALSDYRSLMSLGTLENGRRTLWLDLEACRASGDLAPVSETHGRMIKTGFCFCDSLVGSLFRLYLDRHCLREARSLFDEMPRRISDPLPGNLLLAAYLRNGRTEDAAQMFDEMPARDLISWNTMAAGWVRVSRPNQAMALFGRLLGLGIEPDGFTFSVVLSACARAGALALGQQVHDLMQSKQVEMNPILSSALIDMYSKCGKIDLARRVFETAARTDASVWNSMISGLAIHGHGREALQLFDRMLNEGGAAAPDAITFVGLLTACSHCALVEEGLHHFFSMKLRHSLEPRKEHYAAVVDLLARAGRLEEAHRATRALPVPPDAAVWRALLSGCRKHGRRPDIAAAATAQMGAARCSGDYVMLSGLYSAAGRWRCAEAVWRKMKTDRVRKPPGISCVELGGRVCEFQAGERWRALPEAEEIRRVLAALTRAARGVGFAPTAETVVMDLLEEDKEANLVSHSEKIAVAYAVIKTAPGAEIRVSKNLRTCEDCHSWLKATSKILGREIIVRDRTRFHHFGRGSCSCNDYW